MFILIKQKSEFVEKEAEELSGVNGCLAHHYQTVKHIPYTGTRNQYIHSKVEGHKSDERA